MIPTIVPGPYRPPTAAPGPLPFAATPVAPVRPSVAVVMQGPQGPAASGFGTIDYTDLDAPTPLTLPANAWVRLTRNVAPSLANFNLPRGPWAGFVFWDGTLLHAKALGDLYLYKFSFAVTPNERGSGLSFSVRPNDDPAYQFGPEPIVLSVDAGTMQTGSETFSEQVRTRFAANGATIYVLSTTGGILTQFSVEVAPVSHA